MKKGFTLAEVLITLLVIGIVSALTIPSLIQKTRKHVYENSIEVIEAKLTQALNVMNLAGEINNGYNSSKEFVEALQKHLKIIKICNTDELNKCLSYKDNLVKYTDKSGKEKTLDITKLTSGRMSLDENFFEPVSFVMGNGTPVILSYNKNCISEDKNYNSIHPCVAGVYDINGSRKPNMYGGTKENFSDLISFGGASLGCINFDGLCLTTRAEIIPGFSVEECNKAKEKYPDRINICGLNNDRWAAAHVRCASIKSHLPDKDELEILAQELYNNKSVKSGYSNSNLNIKLDTEKASKLGLNVKNSYGAFEIFSAIPKSEDNDWYVYGLWLTENDVSYYYGHQKIHTDYSICIAD